MSVLIDKNTKVICQASQEAKVRSTQSKRLSTERKWLVVYLRVKVVKLT